MKRMRGGREVRAISSSWLFHTANLAQSGLNNFDRKLCVLEFLQDRLGRCLERAT